MNPLGIPRPQVEPEQLRDLEAQPSEEQRLDPLRSQRPLVEPGQLQDLAVQGNVSVD